MKEVKITIIGDNNSNNVRDFKGEEALKNSALYLAELAGLKGDVEVLPEEEKCEEVKEEKPKKKGSSKE